MVDTTNTKASSSPAPSEMGGAGAPEIELTPAMIEAGCDIIARFFSFELDDPEKVVSSVFLAMSEAAKEAPTE